MADFVTARKQLATLRTALAAAETDVTTKLVRAAQLEGDTRRLSALPSQKANAVTARTRSAAAVSELTAARVKVKTARTAIDAAIRALIAALPPAEAFSGLDPELPVAMFPVRLETRFRQKGTATELLIRVYPDDIHLDSHEPELTEDEEAGGKRSWEALWRAADNADRRTAAWADLCARFKPRRAAWILRALTPTNRASAPKTAVAADASLAPAPAYPPVARRAAAWTRPARARALPDQWVAMGYIAGRRVFSKWSASVQDALAAGPDPAATVATTPGAPPIDEGLRWAVDFAEAERVGMGLRVALPATVSSGVDLLLVFGVKSSCTPQEAATLIETLFDAHKYTGGAAFIPQGFVTNQAEDANVNGQDGDSLAALLREIDAPAPDARANSEVTASAFGISAAVLRRAAGAADAEQRDAAMMNTALWSATWGYYLTQLMDGYVGTTGLEWARKHFIDYVRARGPLPALRIGAQPYGLLPVQWDGARTTSSPGVIEDQFGDLLMRLRAIWDRCGASVPKMRPETSDPDATLAQLLAMQPAPSRFAVRAAIGSDALENLGYLLANDTAGGLASWAGWLREQTSATSLLKTLGLDAGDPRMLDLTFTPGSAEWTAPLVEAGTASEDAPLNANYISWIADSTLSALKAEQHNYPRTALLYLLLRYAVMRELATPLIPTEKVLRAGAPATAARLREPEVFGTSAAATTIWQQLAANASATKLSLAGVLATPTLPAVGKFEVARIRAVRDALTYLAGRPAAVLERTLTETLALCSYRLDAWETSLATRRLSALRAKSAKAAGIQIGGYGWLHDVRPATATVNHGYVHAPSLNQAATAAVLRNGWLAHGGGDNALAIDLSSQRLRQASWLLDGIRGGQSLGRLLGYRFERALHEGHPDLELDQYIPVFRNLAPLRARKRVDATDAKASNSASALAAADVVDGLALVKLWRIGQVFVTSAALPSPAVPAQRRDYEAIVAELKALEAAIDALSDALTAEAVHHLMQGDAVKAGAALDAASTGDSASPELELARTPRPGASVTHRLFVFPGGTAAGARWPGARTRWRARVEPTLEQWAAQQLGDPSRIVIHCEYVSPDGRVVWRPEATANDLGLSALDFVYLAPPDNGSRGTEWDRHCVWAFDRLPKRQTLTPGCTASLVWEYPAIPAGKVAITEALELARAIAAAITSARALDARDLALPTDETSEGIDLDELVLRADQVESAFATAHKALSDALDAAGGAPGPTTLEGVRDALLALDALGPAGCVPVSVKGDAAADPAALFEQASIVKRACAAIAAASDALAATLRASGSSYSVAAKVDHHVARITGVLGRAFRVMPRLVNAVPELTTNFGRAAAWQQGSTVAAAGWLQKAARVRPGAERLQRVLDLVDALSAQAMPLLTVAQLPYSETETWAALPPVGGATVPVGGRVSLVAHGASSAVFGAGVHGLVIDEWVETIPSRTVTTGVALHVNAPAAKAPQAVLLAVTPEARPAWSVDVIEATLIETLQRAQRRTVDPAVLDQVGQFLPALLLPDPNSDHTVSTDLARGIVSETQP